MRVSGTIRDIGEEVLGRPYVTMVAGDALFGVQAVFPRTAVAQVAGLRKGQAITVVCEGGGKLVTIMLNDCVLE